MFWEWLRGCLLMNGFWKETTFPSGQETMLNLVVLFVEYDREKYAGAFEKLRRCLEGIKLCQVTFIIVDNRHEGNYINSIDEHTYRVGGDNTAREFSGWQKGIDVVRSINIRYDAILFSNEAFAAYGHNFIEENASLFLVLKAILFKAVIGKIDSRRIQRLEAFGYRVDEWIRTNCFIVPRRVLDTLGSVITVPERQIDEIIARSYRKNVITSLLLRPGNTINGHFVIEFDVPAEENPNPDCINLRIDINKSFQTPIAHYHGLEYVDKPVCFLLERLEVNGQPLGEECLESGWYQSESREKYWLGPMTRLCLPGVTSGRVTLCGYIAPEIFRNTYKDSLELTIAADTGFFKNGAPISKEYQHILIEWLTVQWHSKIAIDENWQIFRAKVWAILNESLLTARAKRQGIRLMHYNLKKHLDYTLKNALIKMVGAYERLRHGRKK